MKLTVLEMAKISYQVSESLERIGMGTPGWQMCCSTSWEGACGKCQRAFTRHVQRIVDNPDLNPQQIRELWVIKKKAAGWTFGPEKDSVKQTHPKLAPWDDLPACDRIHHTMMHSLVHSIMAL